MANQSNQKPSKKSVKLGEKKTEINKKNKKTNSKVKTVHPKYDNNENQKKKTNLINKIKSVNKNEKTDNGDEEINENTLALAKLFSTVDTIVIKNLIANLQGFLTLDLKEKINEELDAISEISEKIDTNNQLEIQNQLFHAELLSPQTVFKLKADHELHRERLVELKSAEKSAQLVRQIAHDIRSPLSALNILIPTLSGIPEEKKIIITESLSRINDMASALLKRGKELQKTAGEIKCKIEKPTSVAETLNILVLEKQVQHQDKPYTRIKLECNNHFSVFLQVDPFAFKRVVSNIIENAIEAIESVYVPNKKGEVKIEILKLIHENSNNIYISVKDNGRGIEPENLFRVGEQGFTFGKGKNGNGIGIFSSKEWLAENSGTLEIKSSMGIGTEVIVSLPFVPTPDWFLTKFSIQKNQPVVVVDDDIFVHQLWKDRMERIQFEGEIYSYFSLEEFSKSFKFNSEAVYLIDFDFINEKKSGLDFIIEQQLFSSAILCSNRSDDPNLIKKLEINKIKFLPKLLVLHVPIELLD